jgi:ferric-dicitrate binding protein FerR (iron transport regulator)
LKRCAFVFPRVDRIVSALLLAGVAAAQTAAHAPPQQRAGSVAALAPNASVYHQGVPSLQGQPLHRGDAVLWEDRVRTDKQGRTRLTLDDQSQLSLGSNSELVVRQHDAKSQQTYLELMFGKIRCRVAAITGNGKFILRTPDAAAGVVGTDFGADSSIPGQTKFICLSGVVQIVGAGAQEATLCTAGTTVTVKHGQPPQPAQPATPEVLERWQHIAEPGG